MKTSALRTIYVLMAIFLLNIAPQAWGEELNDELSDSTKEAMGCAVFTGVTLLSALAAGPGELIMIAGGGSLAPSGTAPLMVSLTATVFVAACGIGIAATPAVVWFAEQIDVFFRGLWNSKNPAADTNRQIKSILAVSQEPFDPSRSRTFSAKDL